MISDTLNAVITSNNQRRPVSRWKQRVAQVNAANVDSIKFAAVCEGVRV